MIVSKFLVNFGRVEDMIDTYKILLHFNVLLQQKVTQCFQNSTIHQKRLNYILRGNMNMDVSLKGTLMQNRKSPHIFRFI